MRCSFRDGTLATPYRLRAALILHPLSGRAISRARKSSGEVDRMRGLFVNLRIADMLGIVSRMRRHILRVVAVVTPEQFVETLL